MDQETLLAGFREKMKQIDHRIAQAEANGNVEAHKRAQEAKQTLDWVIRYTTRGIPGWTFEPDKEGS